MEVVEAVTGGSGDAPVLDPLPDRPVPAAQNGDPGDAASSGGPLEPASVEPAQAATSPGAADSAPSPAPRRRRRATSRPAGPPSA